MSSADVFSAIVKHVGIGIERSFIEVGVQWRQSSISACMDLL